MKGMFKIWLHVSKAAQWIAGSALLVMFLLTLTEVIGRSVWKPIYGAWEITSFLGGIVIGLAIPLTSQNNAHVNVDFLLVKLPRGVQKAMNVLTRLFAMAFFFFVVWGLASMGRSYYASGEATQGVKIPYYPIAFVLTGAFLIQTVQFLLDIIRLCGGRDE